MIPAEHGGVDIGLETTMLVVERIAVASASCALLLGNCGDGVGAIVHGGSPEQRARLLPGVADGTIIPCFCLTEPGAGSDAAGLKATARRDGDRFRISGAKQFITNGSVGDVFTVWARTDAGISAFLVEGEIEGMTVVRDEDLLGLRGVPATELRFEDTPGELLGSDGEGFRLAMVTLDDARLNISACALGTARGALEIALAHARTPRGVRAADHQAPGPVVPARRRRHRDRRGPRPVAGGDPLGRGGRGSHAPRPNARWRRTPAARRPCAPPPRPCRCSAAPA